jgi:hypothetical protein
MSNNRRSGKGVQDTQGSNQDQAMVESVVVSLWDEPPDLQPGTLVSISVVEQEGPQAVYADLLVNPTCSDTDTAATVDYMLGHCHEEYLEGRRARRSYQDTGFWAVIEHILQDSRYMLETHTLTNDSISKKRNQLIERLVTLCRQMLLVLRRGFDHDAPEWQEVDRRFTEAVELSRVMGDESRSWSQAHRKETASPTDLIPLSALADQLGGSVEDNLLNFEDFDRARHLADRIGLDCSSLAVSLYKHLEVVIILFGRAL